MVLVAVILGVLAVIGLVVALLTMSRLGEQRKLTTAAEERSAQQAGELASTSAALEATTLERAAAEEQATLAAARAADAEAANEQARIEAERVAEALQAAEERAAAAEARIEEFAAARAAAAVDGGIDPELLWTLEQARSERTWRHSVAPGPDSVSVFADATNPLLEALRVELDAAREDVGAIVELDADVPAGVTAAGSVLALRASQELLAGVVRRAEETTLRVRPDGRDLLVTLESVDEDGGPVDIDPLSIPASAGIETIEHGVRVVGAIAAAPEDTEPDGTEPEAGQAAAGDDAG